MGLQIRCPSFLKGLNMQNEVKKPNARIAVVGVGYWGKNLVRNFHELGALEALCDADQTLEGAYARNYVGVRFYSQFKEVLADSSIDGVALATPAVSHYEMPTRVTCQGGAYLNHDITDVTLSHFEFPSGVQAHIFVSWLHPIKEQRLVVVGSEKMAVFDDTADHKLVLYPHKVEWKNRIPTAVKANGEIVALDRREPLRAECQHFLDCVASRTAPVSDGKEGLRVLRVLDACQRALHNGEIVLETENTKREKKERPYFVHESAFVDEGAEIGAGTKVWHFSHVMKGARIGEC